MNTIFLQIVLLVGGTALSLLANYLLVKKLQKDNIPNELRHKIASELREEISQLSRDLVALRGQVKYIEGRLNGKAWQREETT